MEGDVIDVSHEAKKSLNQINTHRGPEEATKTLSDDMIDCRASEMEGSFSDDERRLTRREASRRSLLGER